MHKAVSTLLFFFVAAGSHSGSANSLIDALEKGKAKVDVRLRSEAVEQDNALKDAEGLTIRTRLTYTTAKYQGFSVLLELEDLRDLFGIDNFAVPPSGVNTGEYSVIADPRSTELDQAYLQFEIPALKVRLGRQVITHDGHRFIGHVGWRQDKQTFDAVTVGYSRDKSVNLSYSYVDKRNRIFAEDADVDSRDHLFNASLKTYLGKIVGYGYLLEVDGNSRNSLDTYGLSFKGSTESGDLKYLYGLEYASQDSEAVQDFSADYWMAEAGIVVEGITVKFGYEVLGSDGGGYGFATPLATLHKFNGWADSFLSTPAQGLKDFSLTASGKIAGGKWTAVYHDYEADDSTAAIDSFGRELDLQYVRPFGDHVVVGIKYAGYNAGDVATGKVDTDKFWLWTQLKF